LSLYAEPADNASLQMAEDLKEWAHDQGWSAVDLMLVALAVATEMACEAIEWSDTSGEVMN
jgi:hypothetical protein